ncbi:hypothetical protein ACH4UT_27845 [Streptomyces sp. NPDC020799]|uniref:hypothetical protein n=1 Tax=Streptomyces sp. NPDC020799 TaxID=3365091 RepID=UPI00379D7D92
MTAQPTHTTSTPQNTEFHYITTVQTHQGMLNTRDGSLTVPAGFTRAACFQHLMGQLRDEYGTPISVLFFALEPNQL